MIPTTDALVLDQPTDPIRSAYIHAANRLMTQQAATWALQVPKFSASNIEARVKFFANLVMADALSR